MRRLQGRKEQEALRGLLLGGDFRAAAQRLHEVCPALAENQWLIFQLKKHQFIHLASLAAAPVDAGGEEQAQAQGHLQEALGGCLRASALDVRGLLRSFQQGRKLDCSMLLPPCCATSLSTACTVRPPLLVLQSWRGASWHRWRCTPIARPTQTSRPACSPWFLAAVQTAAPVAAAAAAVTAAPSLQSLLGWWCVRCGRR